MEKNIKRQSFKFIFLFGIVSLFGDITYEGGRSIAGPYLATLGASATAVGLVAGLGEFAGYAFRLISGYFVDKTKSYWAITFIGYGLLSTMPLMAFANEWHIVASLLILERFGKAIRTPAKDTMLSHAAKQVGTGLGFGIHEAIDQIGAIIGPLIFTAVFFFKRGYNIGFGILWIPAALTLVFLCMARHKIRHPEKFEPKTTQPTIPVSANKIPIKFWWYMLFSFFSILGFANFQILAFHFKVRSVLTDMQIPLFYAIAMGVAAIFALIAGKLYDKAGLKILLVLPFIVIAISILGFTTSFYMVLACAILWGIALAIQETIMRAAIADMIPFNKRGLSYGLFNTAYGAAWFGGSFLMGSLYTSGTQKILMFSIIMAVLALVAFCGMHKTRTQTFNH